ncbi:MAG: MazG nucleotide pyrophosphohydrolase domain-containing protein [Marmoricola sp.]
MPDTARPGPREAPTLGELVGLFERLRRECAWKAAQTHDSLTRYLLEEAYEAVEAIDSGDPERIRDELGDVLLQVYLHAAIAAEEGSFDIEDVARGLRAKMIRRNPHVFAVPEGEQAESDPERIDAAWQRIKATERGEQDPPPAPDDDLPRDLPALLRATKVLERRARSGAVGLPVLAEGDDEAGIGRRLLALADEARRSGIDPERALRHTLRELAIRSD